MATLEEDRTVIRQKGVSFIPSKSLHLNPIWNAVLEQLHVLLAVETRYLPYEVKTVVFGVMKVVIDLMWYAHYSYGIYE